MDMHPIPPFSLREFGDLVSAALDPPFSSSSSSTAFSSSNSAAFSSSPSTFSLPLRSCSYLDSDSKTVSVSRDQREKEKDRQRERQQSQGSLRTMLTRFKRRASAFVGGGSSTTASSSSSGSEKWAVVASPTSRTRPTSPSLYRIPELRISAHVTPGEFAHTFVPFVPPVVQYEKQRERAVKAHTISSATSPAYSSSSTTSAGCCGSSPYASSSTPSLPSPSLHASLGAEHMYAHADAASCLSFPPPSPAYSTSSSSPSSSTSSYTPSSSPASSSSPTNSPSSSIDSCSSAASSDFPPTPTMFALPSPSVSVSERRWSVTWSSGEDSNPFVGKPPRSPPCIPSFNALNNNNFPRRRLPSSATLPPSRPPPTQALPPLPLPPLRVRVDIEVECDFPDSEEWTPTHPYATAVPIELLDAFPLPPQHTPTPTLRAPSLRRAPSMYAHSTRSTRSLSRISNAGANLKRAPSFHLPTSTFSMSLERVSALPTPPPSPPTRSRPRLPAKWESEGRTEGRIEPVTPPRKRASSPFPLLATPKSQRDWIQFESPGSALGSVSVLESSSPGSVYSQLDDESEGEGEYHSACSFSS
ncbi:hypothetical protein C8R43DRAFT_1051358 [Mycena crocata]|nr:hypothetical protein C8R43DRAFT_1051358 [Mycena crocata]